MQQFDKIKAKIKLRRGEGFKVKKEAECLDGNTYTMEASWMIEDGMYKGEWAMMSREFPSGAPSWVASGDVIVKDE